MNTLSDYPIRTGCHAFRGHHIRSKGLESTWKATSYLALSSNEPDGTPLLENPDVNHTLKPNPTTYPAGGSSIKWETSLRFTSNVVQFLETSKLQPTLHNAKIARSNFLTLQTSSANSQPLRCIKLPRSHFQRCKTCLFRLKPERSDRLRKYIICVILTSKETERQWYSICITTNWVVDIERCIVNATPVFKI